MYNIARTAIIDVIWKNKILYLEIIYLMRDINKYFSVPSIQLMRASDWTIYLHNRLHYRNFQ